MEVRAPVHAESCNTTETNYFTHWYSLLLDKYLYVRHNRDIKINKWNKNTLYIKFDVES